MNVSEFILAQVAKDEEAARAALSGRFTWASVDFNSAACADHGDRHDPARVLAQCAVYRRIVERFTPEPWRGEAFAPDYAGLATLGDLASIWEDRPDFNPEWAM